MRKLRNELIRIAGNEARRIPEGTAGSRHARVSLGLLLAAGLLGTSAPACARPTVVELYTSQGCSSCPAAATLVRQLSQDPALLALSFHVHYFDNLGWKDPFASPANTDRQKAYVAAMGLDSVYTPQMVIDGETATVGSDADSVEKAITVAENHTIEIPVAITPQADGNLRIAIANVTPDLVAWEMHFVRGGYTNIEAGENTGTVLESTNNVLRYVSMPLTAGRENDFLLPANFPEDGVAIVVQKKPMGRVVGAAYYIKPLPVTASNR